MTPQYYIPKRLKLEEIYSTGVSDKEYRYNLEGKYPSGEDRRIMIAEDLLKHSKKLKAKEIRFWITEEMMGYF